MYLMTKGTVSIVRKDAKGVKEAMEKGYSISGECDASGNKVSDVIPGVPVEKEKELTVEEIKAKLAELEIEIPKDVTKKADLAALLAKAEAK